MRKKRILFTLLGPVLAILLYIPACSGGSPLEPDPGSYSMAARNKILGAWHVEFDTGSRSIQSFYPDPGVYGTIALMESDQCTTSCADIEIYVDSFDREAQVLTLRCVAENNGQGESVYYEPMLIVDFDDGMSFTWNENPYSTASDEYVLLNADAYTNLLNLPSLDFDDYEEYRRMIHPTYGPELRVDDEQGESEEIETFLQIQMPVEYVESSEDNIARWDIYLVGSPSTIYVGSGDPGYVNLTYPVEPYDISCQGLIDMESVVEVDMDDVQLEFYLMTHYTSPPENDPPLWTTGDYNVNFGIHNISSSSSVESSYETPCGDYIRFYSDPFDISDSISPGIYYIPILVELDLPNGSGEKFEGVPDPRIMDYLRVAVEPSSTDNNTPDPGGFRIFYLQEFDYSGNQTYQLYAQDTLSGEEIQLTEPGMSAYNCTTYVNDIVRYDISEDGDRWVIEAECADERTRCFWSGGDQGSPSSGYTYYALDSLSSGQVMRNPRISSDGQCAVYQKSTENHGDPWNPDSRVYITRLHTGSPNGTGIIDNPTSPTDYDPRLSRPYIELIEKDINSSRYVVMYGTDAIEYGSDTHISSGLQFTVCTFNSQGTLTNQEPSSIYNTHWACGRPVISPECASFAWVSGANGNQDIYKNSFIEDLFEDEVYSGTWWDSGGPEQIDKPPMFAYYPQIAEEGPEDYSFNCVLTVFRQGNNKNSDIVLHMDGEVPSQLADFKVIDTDHQIQLTDKTEQNLGEYYDFTGYDDWPDISSDALCVVWMSQADNHGDIFYVDLRSIYEKLDAAQDIEEIPYCRLTFSNEGICTHPMVSNFVGLGDLFFD